MDKLVHFLFLVGKMSKRNCWFSSEVKFGNV